MQILWGMLYADDAGIVSRSSEGLERMMTVIFHDCVLGVRAYGLRGENRGYVPGNQKRG